MSKEDVIKERLGFSGDELRIRLRQYDRAPFIEVLATFMQCMPSEHAIRAFAQRSPDRYINAIATLQRMAGYTDKTESTLNVNLAVAVGRMSDSQLEDKLRELGLDPDKVIDVESAEVAPPKTAPVLEARTPDSFTSKPLAPPSGNRNGAPRR